METEIKQSLGSRDSIHTGLGLAIYIVFVPMGASRVVIVALPGGKAPKSCCA